jgi:hypothetical protein
LDVVDHGTRRWSRMGSLYQLLREPQGFPAHELSRPPVKRFRSHSRACRFSSARTSGSCNFAALSTCCDAIQFDPPPPPVLRCTSKRCFRLILRMGEWSSSCLAAPHLLRARHARPLPSFRGFSFRFATPYSHLRLREDRGLPVLGPCLPLPFPRRPLMSITHDPPAHQLGRGLSSPSGDTAMRYTLSSCTPLPCTLSPCTALPTAGLALASALPRRRSLRGRPCQVTAMRYLVSLRASRS